MTKVEKKAYIDKLTARVEKAINAGMSVDDAINQLTIRQYDFLIDNGVDFDNLQLTAEQKTAIKEATKYQRQPFENGYNKKYPKEKQDLYNSVAAALYE